MKVQIKRAYKSYFFSKKNMNGKDGLDLVYNLTVAEIKLLEQMESYTEKRCQLDIDYAEKLARLYQKMPVTDPDPHLSRSSIAEVGS